MDEKVTTTPLETGDWPSVSQIASPHLSNFVGHNKQSVQPDSSPVTPSKRCCDATKTKH
jgi:hypothetical protein